MSNFLFKFFAGTRHDIELRTVPLVKQLFTRDEKLIQEFISKNSKTNIYFGCCTREGAKGDKEHARELVAFWVDLDFKDFGSSPEEWEATLNIFPLQPSLIINSGGGLHVYWLLESPIDAHDPRVEPILKGLCAALRGDRASAEIGRILRVPETLNFKYEKGRKVELVREEWDTRYVIEDFEPYAKQDDLKAESVVRQPRTEDPLAKIIDAYSDEELLLKIKNSRQGEKFSALMEGNKNGYPGYFSSSGALCSILAFWTRCNHETIDRIYRTSKLYEKKWWEYKAYAGKTRGQATITEQCKLVSAHAMYDPTLNGNGATQKYIEYCTADTIEMEPLRWIWENRIPLGKLTVFCGVPDTGKSTVAIDIASRLTRGDPWPDGGVEREPCKVAMLIAEDDWKDIVRPRLQAAGADLAKIICVTQTVIINVKTGKRDKQRIALDQDLNALEEILIEEPDVRLVIVDPLGSYLGKKKKNDEDDIRGVLTELKEMAERRDVGMVSIDHFNKNVDQAAIHRLSGAGALAAVPRAVWAFVKDKDDPEKTLRLMLNAKLNVVSEAKKVGLKYRSKGVEFSIKNVLSNLPVIEWLGDSSGDLDEVLQSEKDPEKTKMGKCGKWLEKRLEKESVFSRDIYSEAAKLGFSDKTVRRAVKEIGASVVQTTRGWKMELSVGPELTEPFESEE
jgi:archaellum biogenesis ATPase FlaH